MSPRERLLKALRGEVVDAVPWSCYSALLPRGEAERALRERGLALVSSVVPYTREMPNVEVISRDVWEGEQLCTYRTYRTPVGEVTEKRRAEPGYGSSWVVEHMIRRPEDYRVVEFMVRDTVVHPNFEVVAELEADLGGDGVALAWTTRSPYQQMYIEMMDLERMVLDGADGLPEFVSLHRALDELAERIYRLVVQSPATLVWCPDNLTDLVAGGPVFDSYYVPYYSRVADIAAEADKLLVSHFDGRLASLVEPIGRTRLPVIEAFTPPPMGNLGVAQAKAAWPGKVIWINFPGSVFLEPPEEVRRFTRQLLEEAMPGGRFALGITENIPAGVRVEALLALADGVADYEGG
ncbi:MAG: hypothetical protein HPY83_14190 [Anaerolineae bacterium]|nr:hypothetical protein [Anaerolineae bacterium]